MQGHRTKTETCQQVVGVADIAALRHTRHCHAMQQSIKAVATELPLEQILTTLDRLVSMAAFVPLSNAITRRWCGDKIQPIEAWMGGVTGENLHEVAILQRGCQWTEPIIDPRSMAVVPYL